MLSRQPQWLEGAKRGGPATYAVEVGYGLLTGQTLAFLPLVLKVLVPALRLCDVQHSDNHNNVWNLEVRTMFYILHSVYSSATRTI